jgi:hypothetical protein
LRRNLPGHFASSEIGFSKGTSHGLSREFYLADEIATEPICYPPLVKSAWLTVLNCHRFARYLPPLWWISSVGFDATFEPIGSAMKFVSAGSHYEINQESEDSVSFDPSMSYYGSGVSDEDGKRLITANQFDGRLFCMLAHHAPRIKISPNFGGAN